MHDPEGTSQMSAGRDEENESHEPMLQKTYETARYRMQRKRTENRRSRRQRLAECCQ